MTKFSLSLLWSHLVAALAVAGDGDDFFGPYPTTSQDVAENIVSVATGYSQPIRSAPAVTTVITAQQIKDMGARNLYDILRAVPGFFLGTNTIQIEPIISVRGFKSSFNQNVLVLLGASCCWGRAHRMPSVDAEPFLSG
jgi:outer membrane receptor for ferrienterochelin and colicin